MRQWVSGWNGRVSQWLTQRTERELTLLAIAVTLCAFGLLFYVVLRPVDEMRINARAEIMRADDIMARFRAAAPHLRKNITAEAMVSPARAIADSAPAFGMRIRRLEPEATGTQAVLEDSDFGNMIRWLSALESDYALHVGAIELQRRPAPGIVSARVMLRR